MLKKLALMVALSASVFAMHSAELNINDKDLELRADMDLGQVNDTVEPDSTFIGASVLKGSDEHSSTGKVDVKPYYEARFLMIREIKDSGVKAGIGVKANFTGLSDYSYTTIPLGLEAKYTLPAEIPVTVGASVYYAPESLAFSDANSFLEYRAYLNLEMIDRGSVVVGYRSLDTEYKVNTVKSSINLNKSVYFGFKFAF